ncbi:MAG: PEP-utilizing enzyme [Patescibacteria group bacterium]
MASKKDWYVWGEWPGIPWFNSCYMYTLSLDLSKRTGIPITHFATDYKEGVQRVYLLRHEWENGGFLYLKKILRNPNSLIKALESIESNAKKLKEFNSEVRKIAVEACTLNELATLCHRFHKINHELWSAGMVPNLLELNQAHLSGYLRGYINKQTKSDISADDWQILITPTKKSAAQQEELSLLLLANKISKNIKLRQLFERKQNDVSEAIELLHFPKIKQEIRQHYQKYKWLQFGWTGPDSTPEQLIGRLAALLHEGYVSTCLQDKIQAEQVVARKQKSLLSSIGVDREHRQLLQLLQRILFVKTVRMDALYEGYSAFHPVVQEIAKRFSLSLNQLYMVYLGDLEHAVRTKSFDHEKLNARSRYSACIKQNDRLVFYSGEQAHKKMSLIISSLPKVKKTHTVSGECGYPGKISGVIRFVPTSKDMYKVKKGDILLSQATDPSFLPAMEKAAGFVTDLGGLTAHAAIVAREMKKPCVVGTKIATKIFKDGDIVEVDASRGIVKRIK